MLNRLSSRFVRRIKATAVVNLLTVVAALTFFGSDRTKNFRRRCAQRLSQTRPRRRNDNSRRTQSARYGDEPRHGRNSIRRPAVGLEAGNAIVQRNAERANQRHSVSPRRVVFGVHLQTAAHDQRRHAAGRRQHREPPDLVHAVPSEKFGRAFGARPRGTKTKAWRPISRPTNQLFPTRNSCWKVSNTKKRIWTACCRWR